MLYNIPEKMYSSIVLQTNHLREKGPVGVQETEKPQQKENVSTTGCCRSTSKKGGMVRTPTRRRSCKTYFYKRCANTDLVSRDGRRGCRDTLGSPKRHKRRSTESWWW